MQSILTSRLVEFRRLCSARLGWNIETECLRYDDGEVIFKATIKKPDGKVVATGHACEKCSVSNAFENCESKAISRALNNAGFTERSVLSQVPQADEHQERSKSAAATAAEPTRNARVRQKEGQSVQAQKTSQEQELGQENEPNQVKGKAQEQSQAGEPGRARQAMPGHEEAKRDKLEEAQHASNSSEPDERKAEQWARENLVEWLDMPCPFAKAQGRTWRELAENQGAKILMNGRCWISKWRRARSKMRKRKESENGERKMNDFVAKKFMKIIEYKLHISYNATNLFESTGNPQGGSTMEMERTQSEVKRAWLPKKKREILIRRYIERQLDKIGVLPSTREVLDVVGGGQPLILEILREYRCNAN